MVYTIYCILHTVYCILYTIYCILYTIYYILYTIYYVLCTIYYILYTILDSVVYTLLNTIQYIRPGLSGVGLKTVFFSLFRALRGNLAGRCFFRPCGRECAALR